MIELNHISKKYGNNIIFDDLTTTFQQGMTLLLGENGAGKSTLLRLIAGLERPDKGQILYNNQQLNAKQVKLQTGYVPQEIALFDHLSAKENIELFKGLSKRHMQDAQIADYAAQMNLTDLNSKVSALSGGTKRKVNILIGLLTDPEILILDEPTVGIDLKSKHEIHQLLDHMKQHKCIIMTTHHLDEIQGTRDTIKLIGHDPFYRELLDKAGTSYDNLLAK